MQNHFDSWVLEQEVQLPVDKAILGGKFMGSATDGKVAWLKSSVPLAVGDSVTARVSKIAKRSYELEVLSIDQKSVTRMEPFCPHIQQCGGCPWQAISNSEQVQSLSRDIDRMLERATGHSIPWLPPFSDPEPAWRHTARLHSDGKGKLGFYGPQGLLDLVYCPVFTSNLNTLLQAVRALLPLLTEAPAELRISIAENESSGTLSLELHGLWTQPTIQKITEALRKLIQSSASVHGTRLIAHREDLILKAFPKTRFSRSSSQTKGSKKRRASKAFRTPRRVDSAPKTDSYNRSHHQEIDVILGKNYNELATVPHPASAFMQAHQKGNLALVNEVIKGVGDAKTLLELYAGSGNFTLPLARTQLQREILALEYDQAAVEALNSHAQQEQLNIRAQAQDISDLPLGDFDHIILDPPRAGAAPIIDALANSTTKYITYISCHPAALARDLESLCERGWTLECAKLFHLFPHSGHAEVYCRLRKNA